MTSGADATATILVVEDEPTINQAVTDRLRAEGFEVHQAFDGPAAVATASSHRIDAVVLDVMLPGFDGLEVCRRLQAERPVPVLMLTARVEEVDLLIGLGVGADDYMTKPFSLREVVARVRALLRRVQRAEQLAQSPQEYVGEPVLAIGDIRVDRSCRSVAVDGREVHLTPLEFDLLATLIGQPGRVVSRDELMREVWGWQDASGTRTLDSHVKAVRAKIGAHHIRTVHGVGYAFEVTR